MRHEIPLEQLGPNGAAMADAVTTCVHCGFCLPSCPTYQELGEEMDSPRGRIYLMKGVLEGLLRADEVQPHIDRCLGCMACETACPSGVRYHELLLPYRSWIEERDPGRGEVTAREGTGALNAPPRGRTRERGIRLRRWLTMQTLPYPNRFRAAVRAARLALPFRRFVPKEIEPLFDLLPARVPAPVPFPPVTAATGSRRARVALLTGCVQSVLEPAINQATIAVLVRNGVDVIVPQEQGCCGALPWHAGHASQARALARRNLDVFPTDIDAIVVNAAGCGSAMQEYSLVFAGEPDHGRARAFAARVLDVSVFLDELGVLPPPALEQPIRVAMHDACHLCHAQQVRDAPRRLLRAIAGLHLVELEDGERCCGSAGTYNIEQPEIAASLGRRKAQAIGSASCDFVASGNIGCMVQIRRYLGDHTTHGAPVLHTMQILAAAYAGTLDSQRTLSLDARDATPTSRPS